MAGTVSVRMPGGGDEKVDPKSVFVMREATPSEKEESPETICCIWGPSFRIYPADTLADLVEKFAALKLARLTTPGGAATIVSADAVTDRNEPSKVLDDVKTKSILCFGPGAMSPRVRVRETEEDCRRIWTKLGVPTDPFD